MTRRFLAEYRSLGPHALRTERVLAVGRAFLTVSGLGAIYLDPTEPTRFAALTYTLLALYASYSLVVLVLVRRASSVRPRLVLALHAIDILWASALTFFSDGPVSPFFLFFLFAVVAAAFRWAFRETIATVAITVLIFSIETLVAAAGPWSTTVFAEVDVTVSRMIIRITYLLLTGFLLGYLAEQEKQFRAEMLATADAMRQPRLEIGLGGSVGAIARLFLRLFDASRVAIVIAEYESARTLLWQTEHGDSDRISIRRAALTNDERRSWLFDAPYAAWCGRRSATGRTMTVGGAAVDDAGERTSAIEVPPPVFDHATGELLAAVDFGLAGEWSGRIFLYDPRFLDGASTRLHFLNTLATHVTPVLSNVFLLRRLRSRAGAAERARVARELHDGTIQALIGIDMEVEALRREAATRDSVVLGGLTGIQQLLRDEVIGLRELMQALRPVDLDAAHHLPDVLAAIVERFRRDSGVSAHFVADCPTDDLSLRTAVEIVRIVQEALVNVRKHSRARHVIVRLSAADQSLALTIEDDGRGFEFDGHLSGPLLDHPSVGPAIIKERVRAIGGQLEIDSSRDHGARIRITLSTPVHA